MYACVMYDLFLPSFIEVDPLGKTPDRVFVEEASYWGLFALQEAKNEYEFVGVAAIHNKKAFAG